MWKRMTASWPGGHLLYAMVALSPIRLQSSSSSILYKLNEHWRGNLSILNHLYILYFISHVVLLLLFCCLFLSIFFSALFFFSSPSRCGSSCLCALFPYWFLVHTKYTCTSHVAFSIYFFSFLFFASYSAHQGWRALLLWLLLVLPNLDRL